MVKFLSTAFVFLATVSAAVTAPSSLEKRAQCQSTLNVAVSVAQRLQSHYFNSGNGQYTGGSLWTDANTVEDLHNLMLANNSDEFSNVAAQSTIGRAALSNANWNSIINGSNDDALWIVLALWKIGDYMGARGRDPTPYNNAANSIYNTIAGQWDNTCGGGVWWSTAHTYKNAITNQLFLLTSANGYLRFRNADWLANAQKTWNWLSASGMRNSQGLWNDGLDSSTCRNNGQTTWTYNQGVIASGLANLYAATGNKTLLDQAEITLDATIAHLSSNNILRESCDNAASGGSVCNQDQQLFKVWTIGLWTKHVQYYLDWANDPARTAKYSGFLFSQASGVFHFGTNADDDIGSVWYAPNAGGSIFTPKTSASGLEAHICTAKYGPCNTL
ncbi:hypothetical protein NP233_g4060 [Leucocoprinus birnbaumii]|uniref:Glycoside hydrolase family 76 protein n=1 Tax=Leucocoprinus birnbaumii TaxID=56174 RepID=A0AAD5VXX4_9AGAR|nr:hypothetical protein NP233_g4060 [Leucocoprinus birnbaumii]